jgi:F0F1-type ATP synthase membrane subunit a
LKSVYIGLGVVGVLAWLAVGLVVAQGPQPEIVVPAEVLWKLGFLNVSNTMLTAWVVMAVLIIVSLLATRSMKLLPSGLQNFVEATIGFLVDQIEDIAGEKNGRRFFMVVATFFLFILTSNWFGLLPFFNAIGKTEDVGHEIFQQISEPNPGKLTLKDGKYEEDKKFAGWKAEKTGGIVLVKARAESVDFTVLKGDTPEHTLDRYIVFLAHNFAGFPATEEQQKTAEPDLVTAASDRLAENPKAPKLLSEGHEGLASPALGKTVSGIDFTTSPKMALLIPYFRGVFSDVNNTLAMGLCSFLIVEFWGFQSLGLGYLKKFFNFSSPIAAFVGILELLSEFIRVISFAFRLFGNIFAGEVLILMLTFLMPFLFVDIIYGLELFVGFIQAAVFALLTLVFATMAVEHHGDEEHHEGHHGEDATADAHNHPGTAQAH